jgi:transcriptional regulator of acetoin/glycerol metabolism
MVRLDSWARMEAELLAQIIADAGSVRAAAKVLDVPRSTLGARLRRH